MCPANFDSLREWLKSHGGHLHSALHRNTVDGLTGIYADRDLQAGDVIVDIPASLIIGLQAFAMLTTKPELSHERDQAIYVLLIESEKKEHSKFHPWISQLPTLEDFKSYHPIFACDTKMQQIALLNPRLARSLMNFRARIEEFHQMTKPRFEFDRVLWASLVYLTRAFAGHGLVPVCDMFNHNADQGRGLVNGRYLKAGVNVARDEQVYISYGKNFDTLELWLHFGFVDSEAKPVINCSNIRTGSDSVQFDEDCYIDADGPSPRLLERCQLMATSIRSAEVVWNSLKHSLLSELGDCSADTTLVIQAKKICRERAEILESLSKE